MRITNKSYQAMRITKKILSNWNNKQKLISHFIFYLPLFFLFKHFMSDVTTHYGGSLLAICGKDSVILIGDKRMGQGPITTTTNRTSIFKINNKAFIGLSGFLPDSQEVIERIKTYVGLFEVNEGKEISVIELMNLLSYILYAERTKNYFYVQPIVVGIDENNKPRAFSMDCLGSTTEYHYVSTGTAENNLTGLAETLYAENMDDTQLFTCGMQAFLNAVDRDALSGWGAECFIIKDGEITKRTVEGRND